MEFSELTDFEIKRVLPLVLAVIEIDDLLFSSDLVVIIFDVKYCCCCCCCCLCKFSIDLDRNSLLLIVILPIGFGIKQFLHLQKEIVVRIIFKIVHIEIIQ